MVSFGFISHCRIQILLIVIVGCLVGGNVFAAFGGLVPLRWSGQLSYNYGYVDSAGNESETTSLLLGLAASGYIWHPWFASTSMALNIGLSNTETASSSSDSTVGTGAFSVGIFPRSRFPFSMSYSRTDSRSQSFQDISQVSGETGFTVTRLSLRQNYRPRAYNQSYGAWYHLTDYEGEFFGSESEIYGFNYNLRLANQSLAVNTTHSETRSRGNPDTPTTDVLTVTHVYTPSPELGVNSLVSYVEIDPAGSSSISKDSQAFSSFFWRPEHRALNVSGGVRLSENKSEGMEATVSRSLNTTLGVGYRLARSLTLSATASVGTVDSGGSQSLATAQTVNVSYSGGQRQLAGYSYSWQWNTAVSNSSTRTEVTGKRSCRGQQSLSSGIGHNIGKSWSAGRNSSIRGSFSQSGSASKTSELDVISKSVRHGVSLSWNRRGKGGATYVSGRLNDSRSYGNRDTAYNDFSASLVSDYAISRLSSVSGNLNFIASQSESENEAGEKSTSGARNLAGGMSYRHGRPFGIYNMQFTTRLTGSKRIDSVIPTATLRSESQIRYSLGRLSTSLSFRLTESAGGSVTKSMNFQATRSF